MLALFVEMFAIVILIYVLQMYFSVKGRRGILFGCTVSDEQKIGEFSGIIKSYKLISSIVFIICTVGILSLVFIKSYSGVIPLSIAYIVFTFILGMIYNRKTARKKVELFTDSDYANKKQVSIVDMSVKKITFNNILTYIIVGLIFIGSNIYFMINGTKHLGSLFIPIILVYAVYVIADISLRMVKLKIDPANPEDSMVQAKKAKELIVTLNILVFIPEFIVMTVVNLNMLGLLNINTLWVVVIGQIITIIIAVILSTKVSKLRASYKVKNEEVRWKDDDSNWKFGMIYYNKDNPNTIVEKRSGVGVTINAATPVGKIFFAAVIVLIVFAIGASVVAPFIQGAH